MFCEKIKSQKKQKPKPIWAGSIEIKFVKI